MEVSMGGHFKETFGQYLKRERESRSVSLEELSRATRISRPLLEALEKDDFHSFTKPEFIPGFLKGYARHLGLNSEEVLKRYHIQAELASRKETFRQLPLFLDSSHPEEEFTEPESLPSPESGRPSHRGLIVQLAIVLLAIGLSLYIHYVLQQTESPEKSQKAENTFPEDAAKENSAEKRALSNSAQPEKAVPPLGEAEDRPNENSKGAPSVGNAAAGADNKGAKIEKERSEQLASPGMPKKVKVIGNRVSKRYHLPGMKYYDQVEVSRRVEFDSEEEAVKAGYRKGPR